MVEQGPKVCSAAASLFSPSGPIAELIKGFEPRKQQTEMALAVEKALISSKHLIVEAGTGVGKSLAYLFPSALWAVQEKKKVIIATYTKALQEQLTKKDLPTVQEVLEKIGLPFKYFLLMGSANYLCFGRLNRCLKKGPQLFDDDDSKNALKRLGEWASTADSGLRNEIPFKVQEHVWEEVCRDSDLCLGKHCSYREACLYRKDVARARQADLVVVNQHLFFAGIPLPSFDAVIFDEAHNLEEVASHFLGFSLTSRKLKRLFDDVYNPKSGRGLASRLKVTPPNWIPRIDQAINDAQYSSNAFYEDVRNKLGFNSLTGKQSQGKRIKKPDLAKDIITGPIQALADLLSEAVSLSQSVEDERGIKSLINRCLQEIEHLKIFLQCESKEYAYWAEASQSKRTPNTSLNRAPLDVSDTLRKDYFERIKPIILTSATLAVDSSFAMLKSRLGLDECSETLLDSPFEYEQQAVIYNAADIPDPKEQAPYENAVLEKCPKISAAVTGGIFILYTSWKLLDKSSKILTTASTTRPIFKQGERTPQQILNDFKQAGNGILLATDTFWQGIDVPGSALSCVIITRLPFLSPDTPLEEARHEWMAARGMNVFNEYTLPKAVIKFRQGFGRLIRSNTDFGAVVILDPRIRTKKYGAKFLRSIPKCKQVNSLEELQEFFEDKNGASTG